MTRYNFLETTCSASLDDSFFRLSLAGNRKEQVSDCVPPKHQQDAFS